MSKMKQVLLIVDDSDQVDKLISIERHLMYT